MTTEKFRELALSFPGTEFGPHFDRTAFKVTGKRIFATLHDGSGTVNLRLSPVDQSVFCTVDKDSIYPVPNKWGLQGWTTFELNKMNKELMFNALTTAYRQALKPKEKK